MSGYPVKLAQNNPDEKHWTYKRFVKPGTKSYSVWHPSRPENLENLREGYYENLRKQWQHRPDYVTRFADGEYGFSPKGIAVTPEFSKQIHVTHSLTIFPLRQIQMLWDFGLNPTCLITQIDPTGHWNFVHSFVGDGIGVEELIESEVAPTCERLGYIENNTVLHIGDPAGKMREQSSSKRSAVKSIKQLLGGRWKDGEVSWRERIEPAKSVLNKLVGGRGLVQIDEDKCEDLYLSLRGGWHFHKARSGVVAKEPAKDIHSHPGDAFTYGASILYPIGGKKKKGLDLSGAPMNKGNAWGRKRIQVVKKLGFERPYFKMPKHGEKLKIGK